jgi:hypothetical protein
VPVAARAIKDSNPANDLLPCAETYQSSDLRQDHLRGASGTSKRVRRLVIAARGDSAPMLSNKHQALAILHSLTRHNPRRLRWLDTWTQHVAWSDHGAHGGVHVAQRATELETTKAMQDPTKHDFIRSES